MGLSVKYFSYITCMERRLDPLFERDSSGVRRLVAPRPANRLFSSDGDRAQMNAWNEDTVNTPKLFKEIFVVRDIRVNKICMKSKLGRRRKKSSVEKSSDALNVNHKH